MTDRQLFQQALDALDESVDTVHQISESDWRHGMPTRKTQLDGIKNLVEQHKAAITALRERLAHCDRCGKRLGGEGDIHTCSPLELKRFEQWWDADDDIPNDGPYTPDTPIQFAWAGWQAALAQPEQQGDFCDLNCVWTNHHPDCKLAQPEQKPVAWLHPANATCVTTDPTAYARGIPLYTNQPAALMTEFEEAVAAVDNTLHYAIDHWQDRALKAEAKLAQPEQEPVGDEWTPCMKLPVVVHVRKQRPGEAHVSTREGITPVKPDDLIMRGVSGEEYPIGRAIFEQTYSLDATPPAAAEHDRMEVLGLIKKALPEFQQQDDYLLAHGASLMSKDSHEIIHIDTAIRIARAAPPAAAQQQWVELTPEEIQNCYGGQIDDFARALLAKSKERNT